MPQTRAQIKTNIDANITTNGNEEITGAILRSVLNNMADNLATEYAGYQYAGVATPSTNPGTPDGKVFYLASTAGTYTNFGSLTVAEGEVAVLKYNGSAWSKDVTGAATKDELNQLGQNKVDSEQSVNLFDKDDERILEDVYFGNGELIPLQGYIVSEPIFVPGGFSYKYPQYSGLGQNADIMVCDSSGNMIGKIVGTLNNGFVTFSIAQDSYVRVNVGMKVPAANSFMLCKTAEYPNDYVAYELKIGKKYTLGEREVTQVNEMISGLAVILSYFQRVVSINLFDKNNTLNKAGYYSGGTFIPASGYTCTHPIAVSAGVEYKAFYAAASLGSNNKEIPIVNSLNEKVGQLNGVISGNTITFTPAYDCLVSLNVGNNAYLDPMMVCKSSEYPSEYVPYYDYTKLKDVSVPEDIVESKLFGKSVIFTGDSICAGAADSVGGGWASRIGEKNHMVWKNKAVSGGTIIDKNLVGSSFTISDTDFGTGADYIILEGGTNDADRIGSIIGGNTPQYYGSYQETGYQDEFTNQTFCGAVEYLFKKVISTYPQARVGFIIAPKMGATNDYTKEGNNRRAYFETIIKLCKKWGVPVLNLWDECTMNPRLASHYTQGEDYLYADGQHPTAKGYDLMSPIIEEWMKTL